MRSAELEVPPADRAEARAAARLLFQLAVSYTLQPALVMLCGLPAAGKSLVARTVADLLGADLMRSDVLRKKLHGMQPHEHWTGGFNEGPYDDEGTRTTYEALRRAAGVALRSGRSVVIDAGFPRRSERIPFVALSGSAQAPAVWVHVEVPEQVTRERMAERKKDRMVACPDNLAHRLKSYAFDRQLDLDDRIFGIQRIRAWQIISQASERAGIQKKGYPHLLRHSDAIERLRQTGNPKALQIHLGHASPLMTMRYLSTLTAEDALRIQQQVEFDS